MRARAQARAHHVLRAMPTMCFVPCRAVGLAQEKSNTGIFLKFF